MSYKGNKDGYKKGGRMKKKQEKKKTGNGLKKALLAVGCVLASYAAGAIGSIFTFQNIPTWYNALNKPPLNPPNWIFGPVWSTLYTLMGISLFLIIKDGLKNDNVNKAAGYWVYQIVLNTLWSIIFFGLKSPMWAIPVIVLLVDGVLHTIIESYKVSKTAAFLLVPYILWISFATYLNIGVYIVNR
jgi:translocator protein